MKKGANGISPVIAIILTALMAVLTGRLLIGGHMFWGVVCGLISLDFLADVFLSLKEA